MGRRNISLPDELNDKLDQQHLNASGLIQDLLRAYFAYGSIDDAAEYADKQRQGDRERRTKEAVQQLATLEETNVDEPLDMYNDAVLKQAGKLEIPPEAMVDLVAEYLETGEVEL